MRVLTGLLDGDAAHSAHRDALAFSVASALQPAPPVAVPVGARHVGCDECEGEARRVLHASEVAAVGRLRALAAIEIRPLSSR
eukprot:2439511-Prymnesium_polylepis.1